MLYAHAKGGFPFLRPTVAQDLPVWMVAFRFGDVVQHQWAKATRTFAMARPICALIYNLATWYFGSRQQ
jgi:hypothetical protein